jgi:hypothetical protein
MNSAREVGENAEPCTKKSMIMVSIKSLLRYNVIGSRPSKDRLEAESSSVVTKNSNSTENSGAKKKKNLPGWQDQKNFLCCCFRWILVQIKYLSRKM